MAYPSWPELHQLESMLIDMGFYRVELSDDGQESRVCSLGSGVVRNSVIDAAVARLEQETGCTPLLAGSTATQAFLDPPGAKTGVYGSRGGGKRLLRLKSPAAEVSAVSVAGAAKVKDADWFEVRTRDGLAVSAIEFYAPVYCAMRQVSVTARWGRFLDVPGDAWDACLRLAAAYCIQSAREGAKAQPVRWQEGDVSESYGELMLKEAGDGLMAEALRSIRRYTHMGGWH